MIRVQHWFTTALILVLGVTVVARADGARRTTRAERLLAEVAPADGPGW